MKPVLFWSGTVGLLAVFTLLCLDLARTKSATWDETGHVAAGYSYWANGDYRIVTNNLIFSQKFATLPLNLVKPRFPDKAEQESLQRNPIRLGQRFLFDLGNDAGRILFLTRSMIIVLGLFLGLAVVLWARNLFGEGGALLALALYATCPAIIANSSLMTTDIAATLFLFAVTWAWWRLLHTCDLPRILLFGAALALMVLTKYSVVVFVGVAAVLLAARLLRPTPLLVRRPGRMAFPVVTRLAMLRWFALAAVAGGLVAWLGLWAGYGFHYSIPGCTFDWAGIGEGTRMYRLLEVLRKSHLLPEAFIYDLAGLRYMGPRPAFLHGSYSMGVPWFFPVAFLIKTPLPFLLLLGIALGAILARQANHHLLWELLPLVALVAVYFGFSIMSRVNIGHRHLLPIYPPLCVLAGTAVLWLRHYRRVFWLATGLALPWSAATALAAHPLELAYFNPIAGGTQQGWRWLVDSSCDWGGELPALRAWIDGQKRTGNNAPFHLLYFGTARPAYYGIQAEQLEGYFDPPALFPDVMRGGVYCVSATVLQCGPGGVFGPWTATYENKYQALRAELTGAAALPASDARFAEKKNAFNALLIARLCSFLRQRMPEDEIAASMLVFRLTEDDVQRIIHGAPAELHTTSPVRGWREPSP